MMKSLPSPSGCWWLAAIALSFPAAASAKPYTLEQLIQLAREKNPGLAASAAATDSVEAQLLEAQRSWMPTGELTSLIAPAPEVYCADEFNGKNPDKDFRERNCIRTNVSEATINFSGVYTRTELRFVQPLYTFGKISAGKRAATEGVTASRHREGITAASLEMDLKRAYYGIKLANAIYETLTEGMGYLDEAQKRIDKDLKEGTGTVTQTDRFRLGTVRAQAEIQVLEVQRQGQFARNGLRALIGPDAPADIDVDDTPLEPLVVPERPVTYYEEKAQSSRPELRALKHLAASKRALADLEWRKQYPDLVLVGSATFAYANTIDNPRNAFFSDPFNVASGAVAAALRFPIDLGVRNARAQRLRAEANETELREREAVGGIAFEVRKAYAELSEARKRLEIVKRGERDALRWRNAVVANFQTGLAEAKDLSDALLTYFTLKVKSLQTVYDVNAAAAALSRATGSDVTKD